MKASMRTSLAALWLLVLIAVGFGISRHLQVSGDLRKFMPGRRSSRRDVESGAARAADRSQATRTFAGFCREMWA